MRAGEGEGGGSLEGGGCGGLSSRASALRLWIRLWAFSSVFDFSRLPRFLIAHFFAMENAFSKSTVRQWESSNFLASNASV